MSRKLFWKLCLIIATGVVALFYAISILTSRTEEGMSHLDPQHREQLTAWGREAEVLYTSGSMTALVQWLQQLQTRENTWAGLAGFQVQHIAGPPLEQRFYTGYNLGRSVDWKVHLYFDENPVMEVPFSNGSVSFLIKLPDRMRPGVYWRHAEISMQVIIPTILLALLSFLLYRHIMKPLMQLQMATRHFSTGQFDVRAKKLMGSRNDEFSDLATTFDQMAARIGEQITSQRQLISDLSHELRTPLARLDIAVNSFRQSPHRLADIERIHRESQHIRKLMEDTLNLAWLENEKPVFKQESLDLTDLLHVIIDDGQFEFPDHHIHYQLPDSATIHHSSHRAAGQALENILRNALRYTPAQQTVTVCLTEQTDTYQLQIIDEGCGVPEHLHQDIFKPFFRVDSARQSNGFGLGLALAKRQLETIRATIQASNHHQGGLCMTVLFHKS